MSESNNNRAATSKLTSDPEHHAGSSEDERFALREFDAGRVERPRQQRIAAVVVGTILLTILVLVGQYRAADVDHELSEPNSAGDPHGTHLGTIGARVRLASRLARSGRAEAAQAEIEKILALEPDFTVRVWALRTYGGVKHPENLEAEIAHLVGLGLPEGPKPKATL